MLVVVTAGCSVFWDSLTQSPDWLMGDWGPQRAVLAGVMPSFPGLDVPVWNHAVGTGDAPLELYPAWLRDLALWTPFSAAIHGPASLVFALDLGSVANVGARLVFWNALFALVLAWVYRRALCEIDLHGG